MTPEEEDAKLAEVRERFERALIKGESWHPTFAVAEMSVVLKRLEKTEAARVMWERLYNRHMFYAHAAMQRLYHLLRERGDYDEEETKPDAE